MTIPIQTLRIVGLLFSLPFGADGAEPVAPPLPAPTGRVIAVSTEPQLQQAIKSLSSDTTIMIQPGTYRLTGTLHVSGSLRNVTIRGATTNRDDVSLVGPGMTAAKSSVAHGIWTGGDVRGVTIANLTVRDFPFHCIILNGGTEAPHLYNLHLVNAGQQIVKSNPDDKGGGVDDGLIEYSVVEFVTTSRDSYTNGVDVLTGRGWTIRHNLFRNIRAPQGQLAGPALLMWRGSSDTTTEGNTFVNCQRAIAYGLDPTLPFDHSNGAIRNNFIYRRAGESGDTGIIVSASPGTVVAHNTILLSGTYPNAIEYRFSQTVNVKIANNLTDASITQRDRAIATLQNNYTHATVSLFANAAEGDLHLVSSASAVMDKASDTVGVAVDWDGDPRIHGPGADLGADEFTPRSSVPRVLRASEVRPLASPFRSVVSRSSDFWYRSVRLLSPKAGIACAMCSYSMTYVMSTLAVDLPSNRRRESARSVER